MKYTKKDKYKKGDKVAYQIDYSASPMLAKSKAEKSKVKIGRVSKVKKSGSGGYGYMINNITIPHVNILGLTENTLGENTMKISDLKKLIKEELVIFTEAKAGRAWEGKLKQIDDLMGWMYDKDILTKGEKQKKDVVFRQYYRYYNDGDHPRGIGLYKGAPDSAVEDALEEKLDDFIKTILSKYFSKIDRKTFRYDKALGELNTVLGVVDRDDFHGFFNYWVKSVEAKDTKLGVIARKMEKEDKKFKKLIPKELDNYAATYIKTKLQDRKKWTKEMNSSFNKMASFAADASEIINNLITGIKKLKKLHKLDENKQGENTMKIKMSELKKMIAEVLKEEESGYQKFFKASLEKFGAKSPADLDDAKKKEFFSYIEKNWTGKNETLEPVSAAAGNPLKRVKAKKRDQMLASEAKTEKYVRKLVREELKFVMFQDMPGGLSLKRAKKRIAQKGSADTNSTV